MTPIGSILSGRDVLGKDGDTDVSLYYIISASLFDLRRWFSKIPSVFLRRRARVSPAPRGIRFPRYAACGRSGPRGKEI